MNKSFPFWYTQAHNRAAKEALSAGDPYTFEFLKSMGYEYPIEKSSLLELVKAEKKVLLYYFLKDLSLDEVNEVLKFGSEIGKDRLVKELEFLLGSSSHKRKYIFIKSARKFKKPYYLFDL